MLKSIRTGLVLVTATALLGCGSSNETNAGTQPGSNNGGSDASAGASGFSGSGSGGGANGGGSGSGAVGNSGGRSGGGSSGAGATGNGGTGNGGTGNGGTGNAGGGGTPNAGGAGGVPATGSTQCTDGIDNDGDGLIDARDPECTGAVDDDEGSYGTGIPGDNVDQCQDCFFDGDSGQGNDGCAYPSSCFSGVDPGGAADCFNCAVSTRCVDYCKPNTPNGCDCFGCCQVNVPGGGTKTVRLSATCSIATINDTTKCQTCTQSTTCVNKCETCELCLGKTTLPASCTPTGAGGSPGGGGTSGAGGTSAGGASAGGNQNAGGTSTGGTGNSCPTPLCLPGVQPCGVSCLPDCPSTQFCLTGCCTRPPA
jgi:hypothetical protein